MQQGCRILLAAAGWCALIAGFACGQEAPYRGGNVWPRAQGEQRQFAILGAVRQPGVYEWARPSVTLAELVAAAGGMTDGATKNVQIVRQGLPGLRTFYSPDSSLELMAGDVVVFAAAAPALGVRVNKQHPPAENAPGTIHVALVNLAARPVVTTLAAGKHDLRDVDRLIGQSQNAKRIVKVVPPRLAPERKLPQKQKTETPLADGSVLVYDPRTIDFTSLPQLPGPLNRSETETAEQAPQKSAAANRKAVAEPARLSPAAKSPAARRAEPAAARKPPVELRPLLHAPAATTGAESEGPAFVSPTSGEETDAEAAELPSINEVAPREILPPPPPLEDAVPQTAIMLKRTNTDLRGAPPTKTDAAAKGTEVTMPAGGTEGNWLWILLGSGVASVISLAAWKTRRVMPQEQIAPVPQRRGDVLSDLVQNRLPLLEEPVEFHGEMQFHGQPREGMQPRLDAAHASVESRRPSAAAGSPEPHFQMSAIAPTAAESLERGGSSALNSAEIPAAESDKEPSSEPRAATRKLLDRVLTSVQGGDR